VELQPHAPKAVTTRFGPVVTDVCLTDVCLTDVCLTDVCLTDVCLTDACLTDACLTDACRIPRLVADTTLTETVRATRPAEQD
jgi:uncharacterized protein YjbI with pentapeptide repeats